jgi:hypothetical protein
MLYVNTPLLTSECMNKSLWNLESMYIMVYAPISSVYLLNSSHQSACLHVYPPPEKCTSPFDTRQRLRKHEYMQQQKSW